MGLAASQARFLTLTARKSNVEYQGQQINEQRLLLANKSASLQNQMLTLVVPTPPVQTQFMTISKVVTIGNVDYTISDSAITGAAEELTSWIGKGRMRKTENATDYGNGTDFADSTRRKSCEPGVAPDYNSVGDMYLYSKDAGSTSGACLTATYMDGGVQKTKQFHVAMLVPANDDKPDTSKIWFSETPIVTTNEGPGAIKPLFEQGISDISKATRQIEEFDEAGYNDAYNQYKYEQYVYEKALQDINAKTESIHQQDKMLELQLKQLDTEQSALKTEMDAVGKVVKDHVESGFKTFGG